MKKCLPIILCFFVLLVGHAWGQVIGPDSLRRVVQNAEGKEKVDNLNKLAEAVIHYDLAETKKYATEALSLAEEIKYEDGIADAYHKIGMHHFYKEKFSFALNYFNKSFDLAKSLGNVKLVAQATSWLGTVNTFLNDHDKAQEYYRDAIDYARICNDKLRLVYCNKAVGEDWMIQQEYDRAEDHFKEALRLAKDLDDKFALSGMYAMMGELCRYQHAYPQALKYLHDAIRTAKSLGLTRLVAKCNYNIGEVYRMKSDYPKAMDYLNKAIKIAQSTGYDPIIADCIVAQGDIYSDQGDADRAINYYNQALVLSEKIEYGGNYIRNLSSLGRIYFLKKKYDKAIEYFAKAAVISKNFKDKHHHAECLKMEGEIYYERKNYPRALEFFSSGLELAKQIKNKTLEARITSQLALVNVELKNCAKAILLSEEALKIAKEKKLNEVKRDVAFILYKCYKNSNNYQKALEMHELYKGMTDTTYNEESTKKSLQQEIRLEFNEQKALEKIVQAKKDAEKEATLKRHDLIAMVAVIGLVLMLVFAFFIYRSQQKQKKVNAVLNSQKEQIEFQKKEITDSINYSKRIQSCILPNKEEVLGYLSSSFIYYKPKDIVSGDFYYFRHKDFGRGMDEDKAASQELIAVADCTGHGVPGALMSVISYQKLDEAAGMLSEPKSILKRLNKFIKKSLRQNLSDVLSSQDGLDIALLNISKDESNLTRIKYAGANRPFWYIRLNDQGQPELIEVKATKCAIGGYTPNEQEFEQHEFIMQPGQMCYIFSDGYADQFGGVKQKKITTRKFKNLLLSIYNLPLKEQEERLDAYLENWKGDGEQVDDILIIGIKC